VESQAESIPRKSFCFSGSANPGCFEGEAAVPRFLMSLLLTLFIAIKVVVVEMKNPPGEISEGG
jgi:hypothetical protein